MTCDCHKGDNNFIISIIYTDNKDLLKKAYKYFVKSHYKELKTSDRKHKMFNNDKFVELKGAAMPLPIKKRICKIFMSKSNF